MHCSIHLTRLRYMQPKRDHIKKGLGQLINSNNISSSVRNLYNKTKRTKCAFNNIYPNMAEYKTYTKYKLK
mgnify:CR=1 FL=1